MKISVFGVGYVGLVTGACFAELGNEVKCFDVDEKKIEMLHRGELPIYEPGLKEIVDRNYREKRILFTTDAREAVLFGDIIFIAVGTPSGEDGDVCLDYVRDVAKKIGEHLETGGKIVVNKSTVPPGTAELVRSIIQEEVDCCSNERIVFGVASNPEFLKEGAAIDDFMRPDRIVIGTDAEWVAQKMKELYNPLLKNDHSLFVFDIVSAEMTKYASNAFLATKISFMNEMSALCEVVGADVEEVRRGMSSDKRIGNQFLYPGVGYGGSCFPKDVTGLASIAKKNGFEAKITTAVDIVNQEQRKRFINKIKAEFPLLLDGIKFAVWGLSFKPNTDDMREAPSVTIIEELLDCGAIVSVFDPEAQNEARKFFGNRVLYEKDKYDCLKSADALIVVTEWPQFKVPNFEKMANLMLRKLIFDGRNIYSPEQMKRLGFAYVSIGRKKVCPL
ncbi:MAG: UDP-glucose/GDP-mannose dehydrogenase family protein [bacterium]